jgi:uncharacterized membrane protein
MAFCPNCSAELTQGSGFCGSCGTAIGMAIPATVSAHPVPVASTVGTTQSGLTSNVAAALSYFLGFITGVFFVVIEPYKNDRFVRFHAMQSIIFNVAYIAFWIAWSIVGGILGHISGWLALATFPIDMLIALGTFGFWLFLMYQAYNQRQYRIPFIGNLAAKQVG